MTKIDWERARRRSRLTPIGDDVRPQQHANRQHALRRFVAKHDLACFKCGTTQPTEWAKTGVSVRFGPWAICVRCVEGGSG